MSLFDEKTEPLKQKKYREQLHISGVNMMNKCGQQFMFRYILGKKRPPNAFLLVGKSVDEGVTCDLTNKIARDELLPRKEVIEIAASKFDDEQKRDPIELEADEKAAGLSLKDVLGEAKDKVVDLTGLHHDECAPKLHPHRVRRTFSISLDKFLRERARGLREAMETTDSKFGRKMLDTMATSLNAAARDGLDFVGEIDIEERYLFKPVPGDGEPATVTVVRDTKTSKKSPKKSIDLQLHEGIAPEACKTGDVDDSEQLTAYAAAQHVLDGTLPDFVALDYLVKTDAAKPTIKYVETRGTRTLDDVNVFLNRVANTVHAMRSGIFVPTKPDDWACSPKWCGYFDICPYAKRPKFVQIGGAR